MFKDIVTIIQKDLKEILSTRGNRKTGLISLGIMVAVIGIFMPMQSGTAWFTEPILPLVWSWFPVFLMISMVTDSIAGAVVYGWSISVIGNLVATITINISQPEGGIKFYSLDLFLMLLLLPLAFGVLMSSIGVLVSLNAPTARSAYQKLSLVMLALWFLPMFAINFLPEEFKGSVNQFISNTNMIQVATIGIIIVLLLDGFLIWFAMQRFKRTKLILD